jgi:thioredoxin 1
MRHIKIEDGKGRPLGRSFKVKLWPTLIFLKNGKEVQRVVRPTDTEEMKAALARIAA